MKLNADQIAEYDERGALFLPSLLSPREVEVLQSALPEVMARTGPEVKQEKDDASTVKLVFGAHFFSEAFRRLSRDPRLLLPAEQLLRSRVHLFQSRLNPKSGFSGGGWGWHQDYNQWHRFDGMRRPEAVMVAVFLDDVNACNAPLMIIPRSQRRGHISIPDAMEIDTARIAELAAEGGIEAVTGPAGSVLFLHCTTVHGSTPNMSPWRRCLFYLNYNSVANRTIEPRRARYHCDTDFTPLEPLAQGGLLELADAS